jgi:membrane protein DedA with SNARE-associated domain/rhodanese-related sulfurtransferase
MSDPFALVARHGLLLVFANVLVEQAGLPIPALPTMVVAGAFAAEGYMPVVALITVVLVAALVGDALWYFAGRRYGVRVLRLLCMVSLSPDACVRQTEDKYGRWGTFTLVFGKFVPGVSTLAPPLAGAMGLTFPRFLLLDAIGSLLWAGVAVAVGAIFHGQITAVIDVLADLGVKALQVVALLLVAFIAFKWFERWRFLRSLRLARISVDELRNLIDAGSAPVVVDVRSPSVRALDGRYIPGALAMDLHDVREHRPDLPAEREIVFYCSCPNEASAAAAARQLMALGYAKVRPLLGGLDEWVAAGYDVERRA